MEPQQVMASQDGTNDVERGEAVGGAYPHEQGLYNPLYEKDACGVGFVVDLHRRASHQVLEDSLKLMCGLEHRGATGCEADTGDGAGVLTSMPHKLMRALAKECFGREGLKEGSYAVGNVFLPKYEYHRKRCKECIEHIVATSKAPMRVIGWRRVPVDNTSLGLTARNAEPWIEQLFLEAGAEMDQKAFEAALFVCRKRCWRQCDGLNLRSPPHFSSLSSRTITWKGMFSTGQVRQYYKDLQDTRYEAHVAMVHSRFSTNTFPSWRRAHPYSLICHNGEINTLRGNVNWMRAREGVIQSDLLGDQLKECLPIVHRDQSDSGMFDNVLELLTVAGRSLPEAVALMVPGAWQNNPNMSEECRAMYKCFSSVMEPWDGPALIAFTDGDHFGVTLDRNGLRPCRFVETKDGRLIGGSEIGALTVDANNVVHKGRLQPGRMLLADMFQSHRLVPDQEFKMHLASKKEWSQMIRNRTLSISRSNFRPTLTPFEGAETVMQRLRAFGYSQEGGEMLLAPMALGEEALGSMGNDTALAVLSEMPRYPYDFFFQLFAQVTNPPIDPIREGVVMSLACFIGPEQNLLKDIGEGHLARLYLENPVLSCPDLDELAGRTKAPPAHKQLRPCLVDITYPREEGEEGLRAALERIAAEASEAISDGAELIVLSDRQVSATRVPVSGLLATSMVHAHLITTKQRLRCGLVLESAEPHEVHHFCVLFGFGCDAVCPYGAYSGIWKLREDGILSKDLEDQQLVKGYQKAVGKGILKVMSKMGVSCLQSYKGAQIFEAVGLSPEVIDMCFPGTVSRIGGAAFSRLARNALAFHARGFPSSAEGLNREQLRPFMGSEGLYHYRNPTTVSGPVEKHINDPDAIAHLQDAARNDSRAAYGKFSAAHAEKVKQCTIRGQLELREAAEAFRAPVDIDQVEPASEIVKRFRTGAMSYGSISMEAHSTLATAMNRLGGKSNTGEGGEDPERYLDELPSGDSARSAIKQIASGRFGVTIEYLTNSDELQIKMAQGAKPGEGGELPGHKVDAAIAKTRHSTPGVGLISPPPHHDIYSIEDLAQLIYDLHAASDGGNVSVKLVSEAGVGVVAAGVAKAKADHILISGFDGGTGASRWTGIKHAGLPWELGIAETHQTLVLNGLRGRVSLETDGNLRNGKDIVMAALLGAEQFGLATAPLIAMGCIMMRKCHLNTCPVGIATQDPELRKKFEGKPEHVVNYLMLVAEEVRVHLAKLGFKSLREAVGHAECLRMVRGDGKESGIDLSNLVTNAADLPDAGVIGQVESHRVYGQDHGLDNCLDRKLLEQCQASLSSFGQRTELKAVTITNVDRTVGALLSHKITKAFYPRLLDEDTVHIEFKGTAGQSFGAFTCTGMTLAVEGEANDYCGKGLSGGILVVAPPKPLVPHENIIVGNVTLYGATSGRAFFSGVAAERFCVRNSGAMAVCEGVGDHGCEYMTGGRCVVLGSVGTNFAAGMSGGIAYVWDPQEELHGSCNREMVELFRAGHWLDGDEAELKGLVEEHALRTGSPRAAAILESWAQNLQHFIKVFPTDYRLVLEKAKSHVKPSPAAARPDPDAKARPRKASEALGAPDVEDMGGVMKKKEVLSDTSTQEGSSSDSDHQRPSKVENPAKARGFITYERADIQYREALERAGDFIEVTGVPRDEAQVKTQAARCMDCGVPFCHQSTSGCPLGNLIPEWNTLASKGEWKAALDRLLETNNFPEFTGRVCPAPCEGACVLGIIDKPVNIKSVEVTIIDKAWQLGLMYPRPPQQRSGRAVAIIGSGPAGLAAADQLNRVYGHTVEVFERADRIGGLMMYGVPNMKADKVEVVERRVSLMSREGVTFHTGANFGGAPWLCGGAGHGDAPSPEELKEKFDAILLSTGATAARDLRIPGRGLPGIHLAMEFLHRNTQTVLDGGITGRNWRDGVNAVGPPPGFIDVKGKHVVVIGGGDTGNDCIGTAMRQGCASLVNFEIMPEPPAGRNKENNPWPQWPRVFRVDYGHKEVKARDGADPRQYLINAKEFIEKNGRVVGVRTMRVEWVKDATGRMGPAEVPGSEETWPCDYCFLAMGFLGPEVTPAEALGVALDPRSNYQAAFGKHATNVPKVFAAGDCRRGQSLVVWAIAEGRRAAESINSFLQG